MWLPPLADRFVRLTLQLLARYATWLQAGLAARSAATSATISGAAQPPQVGRKVHSIRACCTKREVGLQAAEEMKVC